MANDFSREEVVAFENVAEGFNDALVLSRMVSKYQTDGTTMARTNDIIWRPMPYIGRVYNGTDATGNFNEVTQLAVPATLGYQRHATAILSAQEMRDSLRSGTLGQAAKQALASEINQTVMTVAATQGTLVSKITTAAGDYDDIATCDSIMNEQGVPAWDRYMLLNSRDYNGMAGNLATSTRSFGNNKSDKAYEKGLVGMVSGFDTYKLDYPVRLTAAAGGGSLTIDTRDAATNYYVPAATSTAATGETSNVDNRYQTITISSTTNVAAGDCFTVAALNSVHHISKTDTGQLKTFRVISVDSATTMTISPPMITGQGGSDAEIRYQNCVINTKAANSAIVFLNTTTAGTNVFFQKDAIELLPGSYQVEPNSGVAVMRATSDQGIEITMTRWFDGNTFKHKYRWDVNFGVVMKQPEMAGILLFGQS